MPDSKSELDLIHRFAALLRDDHAANLPGSAPVPFGDDMAALPHPFDRLLLSCDMLMDGVDFRSSEHPWRAIGRKAIGVNLSDCAAMAARPLAALVSVALNNQLSTADALELLTGIHEHAREFGCRIVGGDTNSWDYPAAIDVTIAAEIPPGRAPVRRDGARPGDRLYVTGPLGGSILGRHLSFRPRVHEALALASALQPSAMIDISDGFALDLWRILSASNCGAEISAEWFERAIHPDARDLARRDGSPALEHALYDGEDFELIVAVPPHVDPADCVSHALLPVGRCVLAPGPSPANTPASGDTRDPRALPLPDDSRILLLADGDSRPIQPRGWQHFR